MKSYVAGLMFKNLRNQKPVQVALILKDHPEWQAGKVNAIGGKIKVDASGHFQESIKEAMVREFREETGCITSQDGWRLFCRLHGLRPGGKVATKEGQTVTYNEQWEVYFFVHISGDDHDPKTTETETVAWHTSGNLNFAYTVPNLQWLIPLALDKDGLVAEVVDNYVF